MASGKGGTGKTTVALNLARAVEEYMPVHLMDCDVEEPNCHLFLKPDKPESFSVNIHMPEVDPNRCSLCGACAQACQFKAILRLADTILTFPELCHGCGACSLACKDKAITEVPQSIGHVHMAEVGDIRLSYGELKVGSTLTPAVVRAVKKTVTDSPTVILDSPPGTSCPMVTAVKGTDFVILVAEQTEFGLHDLKASVTVLEQMRIPYGVVINRDGLGGTLVDDYCQTHEVPVLLRIPYHRRYAAAYAKGDLIVDIYPELKDKFLHLWQQVRERVGQV